MHYKPVCNERTAIMYMSSSLCGKPDKITYPWWDGKGAWMCFLARAAAALGKTTKWLWERLAAHVSSECKPTSRELLLQSDKSILDTVFFLPLHEVKWPGLVHLLAGACFMEKCLHYILYLLYASGHCYCVSDSGTALMIVTKTHTV